MFARLRASIKTANSPKIIALMIAEMTITKRTNSISPFVLGTISTSEKLIADV